MGDEGGARLGGEWLLARRAAALAGVPLHCVEAESCLAGGVLVSIDGYSASESKPGWLRWEDWGWRAVIAAASDVIASGGAPVAVSVSVGAGEPSTALRVAEGAGEAARSLGAVLASGDLNSCPCGDAWVDVAVVGRPVKWLTRRGASPGDYIVQIGYIGYGAVASAILRGKLRFDEVDRRLALALRRPRALTAFPTLARLCGVKAAIDNSDGWAYTVAQLAHANMASAVLHSYLADPEALDVAGKLGYDVDELMLASWEDYNIAAAVPREGARCLEAECRRLGIPCLIVGRLAEGEPGTVYYRGKRVEPGGWSSF